MEPTRAMRQTDPDLMIAALSWVLVLVLIGGIIGGAFR
jgi:hypothetical protein